MASDNHCRSCGCELQPWESDFCEGCGPFFLTATKGKHTMRARTTVVADVTEFPFSLMKRQDITPLVREAADLLWPAERRRVTVLLRAPEYWDESENADLEASEELADICFDLFVEASR